MNKYNCSLLIFCSVFLFCSFPAKAIERIDSVIHLEEINIRSSRLEDKGLTTLSGTTISRQEIEAQKDPFILSQMALHVPGVFVTQKGSMGFGVSTHAAGTVSIRGVGGGNKVLMMTNGVPQWAGIFGHSLPDTYLTSTTENMEVVKGPLSLIYGSGAMGGAINLTTRKGVAVAGSDADGLAGKIDLAYGSYQTLLSTIAVGNTQSNYSYSLVADHNRTEGDRKNARFNNSNVKAQLGFTLTPHWQANLEAMVNKSQASNPGEITDPLEDNDMDILRGNASLALENHYKHTSGSMTFYYNGGKHKINDGYHPANESPKQYRFHSKDYLFGLATRQAFTPFTGNRTIVGYDLKQWGGNAWNKTYHPTAEEWRKDPLIDKTIRENGLYLVTQQWLIPSLSLLAGLRWEHNSTYGSEWIPQGGITLQLPASALIKGTVSKGFRSPNIRELYMYKPANPDLAPERMISYDLTWEQHYGSLPLFTSLSLYYIEGKNMVQTLFEEGRPINRNTGTFYHKGIDLHLSYSPKPSIALLANYSFLLTNKPVLSAPKHQLAIGATYHYRSFDFALNGQWVNGLYTSLTPASQQDYFLLDARVNYRLNRIISFFIKGENLTNARYETIRAFPMPGISCMGGCSIQI